MGNTMKRLGDIPYGSHLKRILKDFKIILSEQPDLGKQLLDDVDGLFENLKNKYLKEQFQVSFSKRQYIAVVGDSQISNESIIEAAREFGLTKSNVKILGDFAQYKTGRYNELLKSSLCVGVIFGPVPHNARNDIFDIVKEKSVLAKTKSGKLKLTKESLQNALKELV